MAKTKSWSQSNADSMQAGLVEDQYEKITQLEGKPFDSQSTSQH